MKQTVRAHLLIVPFLFILVPAFCQHEGTLYFMNSLPQATYLNPAITPRYKFSLGVPGSSIFLQQSNNGFSFNDIGTIEGNIIDVQIDKLYSAMAEKNYVTGIFHGDIFRVSKKANARLHYTLNSTFKTYNRIMLPRDVLGIFVDGTLAYVNNTATLSPQVDVLSYLENGVGGSYIVSKKLTVGAKVKVLHGLANATTNNAVFDLSLDEDYAITIRGNADIKTSGVHAWVDSSEYDFEDDYVGNIRSYLSNIGFAFDLGALYKVNEKLTIGASVIDLGGIRWKNDVYGYRLDPARAQYTFRGFDLERAFNGDGDYFDAEMDSIQERFTFEEGQIESYRTSLPLKAYFSGTYQLARNFNAGIVLYGEWFGKRFSSGGTASICKDFGRRLTASVSYTITNRSFNNIGAGLSLNFAPFQLYVVGDNLLGAPLSLLSDGNLDSYVHSMRYFNIRTGLNFVFGWDKTQEKQPNSMKLR